MLAGASPVVAGALYPDPVRVDRSRRRCGHPEARGRSEVAVEIRCGNGVSIERSWLDSIIVNRGVVAREKGSARAVARKALLGDAVRYHPDAIAVAGVVHGGLPFRCHAVRVYCWW